jgi:hypothetical protein
VKAGIDIWMTAAGLTTGTLFRSINKAGRIWGNGFSPKVIWGVVKDKAKACSVPKHIVASLSRAAVCSWAGTTQERTEKARQTIFLSRLLIERNTIASVRV